MDAGLVSGGNAHCKNVVELLREGSDPFVHLAHVIRNTLIIQTGADGRRSPDPVVCNPRRILLPFRRQGKLIAVNLLAVFVTADTALPGVIVKFLISQPDNSALVGQVAFIQILQVGSVYPDCDRVVGAVVSSAYLRDLSGKILTVIAVTHLHQALERSPHGRVIEVELLTVFPIYVIQTVDIRLIYLLIAFPGHALQPVVLVSVHQNLPAGDLYKEPVRAGLPGRIAAVDNGDLLHLYIDNLGKLVKQKLSPVSELVCLLSRQLYRIDLLIQSGDLSRQGIHLVDLKLDLLIGILLKSLQIPRKTVKILGKRPCIANKL